MNWFNALVVLFEAKKQYVIVTIIIISISAIGGYYLITNNYFTEDITINMPPAESKPKIDPSKSSNFRKGEFKESETVSY